MNPLVFSTIKQFWYRLPNWVTSVLGLVFGLMVALNIITWDSLLVFFDQPFNDWFGEIWNYVVGGLIVAGGVMYDPRSEKVILLTDEINKEDVDNARINN